MLMHGEKYVVGEGLFGRGAMAYSGATASSIPSSQSLLDKTPISRWQVRPNQTITPMTGTEELHLSQRTPPPEKDIDGILGELSKFLVRATFKDKDGIEQCSDEELREAAGPLFSALGFQNKINSKRMQCNALRLRPGTTPLTAPSADLIPVTVWGKNPTIEGMELTPGSATHITKGIRIRIEEGSALDLLFLVEKVKEK
ncbi:hypothetical protein G7Y89_g3583 [Cudoniella acicularis]|uniref:Uncharacterized protein n=1 Tax=Cudoniella acicularis TaxID=354080 RepID=A0A8H4W525_9HELO|nr:hypothetical protein G7Y89_g3583 [Cudoniella acicularis]